MKLHLTSAGDRNLIRRYGPDEIVVNEHTHHTSLIVTPDNIISDWPPRHIRDLAQDHVAAIVALSPELVILGSGPQLRFPSPPLVQSITLQGIGLEVMDTAAACRTFNILVGEGRMVAAALILPPSKHTADR